MKIKELRELTIEELGGKRRELGQEMLSLRVQQASGQLENPTRLALLRREVARTQTILSERRLNLNVGQKAKADAKPAGKKKASSK